MKGINAIENTNDPGKDGFAPATGVNNPNTIFAKDLAAFSLEYFNNDYKAINTASPFAQVDTITSHPTLNSSQLFNGNIRYMQTRLTNPNTGAAMPMLNAYKYDQLNRLKESRSYETGLSSNVWNPTTYGNSYYNAFTYDAMGNILTQVRHNRAGTKIEDMKYKYQYLDPATKTKLQRNRLYHIYEPLSLSSLDATDIDNMGAYDSTAVNINVTNNYVYDEEGRLVKDSSERISKIVWRVDGKVKEIQRNGGSAKWLRFDYDAMGKRIAKHVYANNGSTHEKSTYYILDAQGNQMNTYDYEVVGGSVHYNLKERNIYGSNRTGSKQDSINILTATLSQNYTQILGKKYYEFTNHLGNVLTVFTDLKVALDTDANNVVDGYKVQILNIADYSPFGVQLDERTLQNDFYRLGFNGMEKDNEIKGNGNSYDFGARFYDARIGRFLSLDKFLSKAPHISHYSFAENMPVLAVDIGGDSVWVYSEGVGPGGIGRHMYMRVKTSDKDVIIELGGPHAGARVGQPKVYEYKDYYISNRKNIEEHLVLEPINKNNPDKFENDIIKYAEFFVSNNQYKTDKGKSYVTDNPLLPTYNKWGPNSNGFVKALIAEAGGYVKVDKDYGVHAGNPLLISCLPGTDWKDMKPYIEQLQSKFSENELYSNTYGLSKVEYKSKVSLANKMNSKQKDGNLKKEVSDNTSVNNLTTKNLLPKRRKLEKSN